MPDMILRCWAVSVPKANPKYRAIMIICEAWMIKVGVKRLTNGSKVKYTIVDLPMTWSIQVLERPIPFFLSISSFVLKHQYEYAIHISNNRMREFQGISLKYRLNELFCWWFSLILLFIVSRDIFCDEDF